MKYLLIVYCLSSAFVYAAASDSPKKSSRRRSSKNIVAPSTSPVSSPKDRSKLMHELSKQSKKTANVREQNPYVLPLGSRLPRSTSNPEQLGGGSLMLLDEVSEALREAPVTPGRTRKGSFLSVCTSSITIDVQSVTSSSSESSLSPRRDVPVSPGRVLSPRTLTRVASLNTCGKAMDAAAEREIRKQEYRNQLSPQEQRIFDVVGLKNLEFIKKQPNLLQVLGDVHDSEIDSWYQAYLRSTILVLQKKLEGKRAAMRNLDSRPVDESPRDDSLDAVVRLIQEEQKDDLSPRKDVINSSLKGVRDRIKMSLEAARKETDRLIGAPKPVEDISGICKAGSSISLPAMSNE